MSSQIKDNHGLTTIEGFDGYFITRDGRVYSNKVYPRNINGELREKKLQIDKYGYLCTILHLQGKMYHKMVHRLIAQTFIPNPENKPCVNHIDGNKLNNNDWNLEWATVKENNQHAYDNGLNMGSPKRSVDQYDLEGNLIAQYISLHKARDITGVNLGHICDVCKGNRPRAGGYRWAYSTI